MVSNALEIEQDELIQTLKRLRREHRGDEEYKEWRRQFPKGWPI